MRKKSKAAICIACAAVLLIAAAVPWILYGVRKRRTVDLPSRDPLAARKTVEFGSYPQSAVTEPALVRALNDLEPEWISYGYYSGDVLFGTAKPSDCMQYADVEWNGTRYRAVTASDYRPYGCRLPHEITRLDTRLELNEVYWFRFEPIRWIVLDEKAGLMMSEHVLDCGAFCNVVYANDPNGTAAKGKILSKEYYSDPQRTVYATDYPSSDVRKWLNGAFLNTAFTDEEQAKLSYTLLDNRAADRKWKKYDAESCEDRVFLLSYADVLNPDYGFSPQPEKPDPLRAAYPTDYALAQGCWAEEDPVARGAAWWWLRTPSDHSNANCDVSFYGTPSAFAGILPYFPDFTDSGYRPAIRVHTDT
jgi:hypothetical protein